MRTWITALLLLTGLPLLAGVSGDLRKADKLFHHKKYGQALSAYQQVLKQEPTNDKATFGVGASAYFLKDYKTAEQAFESISAQDEKLLQDALFNLGTSFYRAEDKEKAKLAYRKALLKNPNDKEALHNYQIILEEEGQSDNQSNDQNKENKNDKDQQNSDQQQQQNQDNPDEGQGQDDKHNQNPDQTNDKNTLKPDDAQRVMQMARDSEHKPQQAGKGQTNFGNNDVERDW